jgi:hypothetical protein
LEETNPAFGADMFVKFWQHTIRGLTTRIFSRAATEQECGPRETEQLADAIVEYGRMRQEHYGSREILVGAGEVAMRLRETTHTIVKVLETLTHEGRAEETIVPGRWRLFLPVPLAPQPGQPIRQAWTPGS